jgi:dihydrofolate reductase
MLRMTTRKVRYVVAASLDGYIAGPNGEYDWIPMDPEVDFGALYAQFDTVLMGRHSYELMLRTGEAWTPGMETFVFSRTLAPADHPKVRIVSEGYVPLVNRLRSEATPESKDIWLFGGGSLFASLAEAGLVDTVEVAVVPVLLGGGIPLLPPPATRISLTLQRHRLYAASGIVTLEYAVG